MNRLVLSALLLLIVAVWGWTFVLVKDAVQSYGVLPFLAVRFAIGATCVGLFAARRASRRTLGAGALIGTILALAFLLQTSGLQHSTATSTAVITGLFIIFAPLANRLLFGVRTNSVLWGAICISLIGLTLLTGAAPTGPASGDLLALGGAACFGLHVALLDRYSKQHQAGVLVLGQLLGATSIFASAWLVAQPPTWPPPHVWPALLITGVVATAAAYFVQTYVQQRLSAVETAMIILTEPLFAAIFGYALHGDRLNHFQILGAILMVSAVFATELYPLVRRDRTSSVDRSPPEAVS